MPLALRDQKSLSKLCSQHIEILRLEDTKCERALKRTNERKNECMKDVLRLKETNRYFFTQNPNAPPYYYPEKDIIDERATHTTKDSSSPNDTDTTINEAEISPRTQAKRDYKQLFGDAIIPVPTQPGLIKKALEERRKRDGHQGEDEERVAAALLRKERE